MKTFSITDVGRKREVNQDYVFTTTENHWVFSESVRGRRWYGWPSRQEICFQVYCGSDEKRLRRARERISNVILVNAIKSANHRLSKQHPVTNIWKGMGTTVVAATVIEQMLYFANVGDSRLYLINDEIQQLSRIILW